MSRRITLLLMLLLAMAVALLATRLEVVSYIEHQSPAPEVQQNPFLGAEKLLSHYGHQVRHLPRYQGRHHLPDTDSLMVLDQGATPLEDTHARELLDWVADGGWLVLGIRGDEDRTTDPHRALLGDLLGDPGLALVPGDGPPPDPYRDRPFADHLIPPIQLLQRYCGSGREERRQQCIRALCGDPDRVPANTRIQGRDPALALEADPRWSFQRRDGQALDDADAELLSRGANRHGTQWLELQLHQGRLMLVTDVGIWNNRRLHYLDHARLLDTLASERATVRLISGTTIPLLHVWLWQRAWPLLLLLALLLAAWLWRRIPRRGPRLEPGEDNGRDFLAHLRASGLLLWRRGRADTLLAPLREEVRALLARRGVAPQDMSRHIALHAGLDQQRVETAMNALPEEREALVDLVSTLQTIRNHYGQQ